MASVNTVILVGNAGRDPDVRTFPSGDKVANVSIATTETWKDKATGEKREATEWHRLQFNGRLAEIVEQYVKKGSQLYVQGSIKSRKYTKDNVEMTATEIRVDTLKLLGGRPDGQQGGGYGAPAPQRQAAAPAQRGGDLDDDPIPF